MDICDLFDDNRTCRLCMTTDHLISIFDYNGNDNVSLAYKIEACTSIQISPTDILPKNLCQTCLNQINQSFVFLQRSQYINNFLQCRYVQNLDSVPLVNTYNHLKIKSIEKISFEQFQKFPDLPCNSLLPFEKSQTIDSSEADEQDLKDPNIVHSEARNLRTHLSCTICSTVFNRNEYLKHYEKHRKLITTTLQNSENRFKSTVKKKRNPSEELNFISMFRCEICKKIFTSWVELRKHFFKDHKRNLANLKRKCLICNSYYPLNHLKTHYHNEHTMSFCEICNIVFFNGYYLEIHIALKHRQRHKRTHQPAKITPKKSKKIVSKPYFCCVCKKSYSKFKNLLKHVKNHSKMSCKICKKRFFSKNSLLKHKNMKHSKSI